MPSVLVVDTWNCVIGGQEPWPDDVQLFQPYEMEQILLPDTASCLSVQSFLNLCNLKFTIICRTNAEDMSPSGKVPFIKCGACLVSELEPIISFVANKGFNLSATLTDVQKADMRAYMSLVNTVLGNAENYITWVHDETYRKVTKPRYGSVHPFPLNHILCYLKRRSVIKRLHYLGWADKSLKSVYEEVDRGCSALSDRLEKSKYFFGEQPCEADACLFGHVYAILVTPSSSAGVQLSDIVRKHRVLVQHCKSLMGPLNLTDNIEIPRYHKSFMGKHYDYSSTCSVDGEFIFTDQDDISTQSFTATQEIQDYSCLMNDENLIYDSVFGDINEGSDCDE